MPKVDPSILTPGRSILYRPSDFVGWVIAVKTFSLTAHIETIVSETTAIGARLEGVNEYPIRNDKYICGVIEPVGAFNLKRAMEWFNREAKGDKYWVGGLFKFFAPKAKGDDTLNYKAEFCSMLCHLFYERGGFYPFAQNWPALKTAPAQFWQTPLFRQVFP